MKQQRGNSLFLGITQLQSQLELPVFHSSVMRFVS